MDTPKLASNGKKIILIGGNSAIVQSIIKSKLILNQYDEVIIICHTKYRGGVDNLTIMDNINPISASSLVLEYINQASRDLHFDLIISNTPTNETAYCDDKTLEWGLLSARLLPALSRNSHVNRALFLGSSLALIPFYHGSLYKRLKQMEFSIYQKFCIPGNGKIAYFLLPPIAGSNGLVGLGRIFAQPREIWINNILSALTSNRELIVPKGLVGVVCRIFLLWRNKHALSIS